MSMSKSAAIREAASYVSIGGGGTSWRVYGPYRYDQPTGPSTEISCDSYRKARACAATKKAAIALHLMGRLTPEAKMEIECAAYGTFPAITQTRRLVEIGLKA